jgi:hypothetical protein
MRSWTSLPVKLTRRSILSSAAAIITAPALAQECSLGPLLNGSPTTASCAPQYPTAFTRLNEVTPYPVRPPWKVAGVDYRVGINAGVSLKDPATISSSIATTLGTNPIILTVIQDNVTLDGYDFTLRGGYQINTSNVNLTISNSKLQNLCMDISAGPLTVEYCEINGLGSSGETKFGCLAFLRGGVTSTWKYNWFFNCQSDFINLTTADLVALCNLFDTLGFQAGAHADAIQFCGSGTANNIAIVFNTFIQTKITPSGISSFVDLETQLASDATMNNPIVACNTAMFSLPGQHGASTLYRISQTTGRLNSPQILNNYADPRNTISVLAISGSPRGVVKSGNILLTTGRPF